MPPRSRLWQHDGSSSSEHRLSSRKSKKFEREPDTPTLIISLVLGVAGLLILILLLSMVFITLAESKEQQLVAEGEEEEEVEEVEGQHRPWEEEVEEEMTSGTTLISSMKSQLARVVLPLGGLKARLEERNYIQVI